MAFTDERLKGWELLDEVFDLLSDRIPDLALDDPARPALLVLLPELAATLGRQYSSCRVVV